MSYEIVVCGHLCLDLLPGMGNITPDNLVTTGKLFETSALQMSTGGAVSNTGLALHRLGINVGLMGLVGDDLLGRVIIAFLRDREHRLGDHIHVVDGMPSSYTVVLAPENRDRTFLHCTGTNDIFDFDQVDFEMVAQGDMFHLGYPTILPRLFANDGDELVRIFKKVHSELGIVTSLDLSLPDPNRPSGQASWIIILQKTLPYVDIFIPSIEEILFILRRDDYDSWGDSLLAHITSDYMDELAQDLIHMGSAIVGFKLGESGFYIRTASDSDRLVFLEKINQSSEAWVDKAVWQKAFQVEVAGTTGAGDSAYAGFLTALYHGLDIEACAKWACAVGACNVEASDATSGILSWEATAQRLASDWKTITPISDGS